MNRLKELRIEKDLSQTDLSNTFQVTQQTISAYENGSRDISTEMLSKFSDYFDCSIDYLLGKTTIRKWVTDRLSFSAIDDLDEDEIAVIQNMIDVFRKKHEK